jgi:hypothetical protein
MRLHPPPRSPVSVGVMSGFRLIAGGTTHRQVSRSHQRRAVDNTPLRGFHWLRCPCHRITQHRDILSQSINLLLSHRDGIEKARLIGCESSQRPLPNHVRFSNRPFGVKRFQAIHHSSVDVAHGLVLLFGIGTKALPSWDSKTRWNNLLGGLAVSVTAGPSGHTISPHPSSREGHHSTAGWNSISSYCI